MLNYKPVINIDNTNILILLASGSQSADLDYKRDRLYSCVRINKITWLVDVFIDKLEYQRLSFENIERAQ